MKTGRMTDTTLVAAMLALVVVVGGGMLGSVWLAGRSAPRTLDKALDRQPAELVDAPEELITNVAFEPDGPQDCRPGPVEVLAIDIDDASVVWRQNMAPVASDHHAAFAVIVDDADRFVALAVDEQVGDRPPSVIAFDVATGEPRWQRFIAADFVHPVLIGPESLVLSTELHSPAGEEFGNDLDEAEYVSINADGAVLGHASAPRPDGIGVVPVPEPGMTALSDTHPKSPSLADWPGTDNLVRATWRDDFGHDIVEFVDPQTGELSTIFDVPFSDDFNVIGAESSPGEPVQVNDDQVLVVIGSSFGPNTRLAAFDRADGSLKWSLDHARAAAIAGADIVYDKRNDEDLDAAATRDIFLVDGNDPEREIWTAALSVNANGGNGFLGRVDDATVFAVRSDNAADDEQATGLEFLVIGGAADLPAVIEAAEDYGSGPTGHHHVDTNVLAAATPQGVMVQPTGQAAVLIETVAQPTQVTRAGDLLLVTVNHSNVFCD